jgi:LPXTG cell wall anchor motif
MMHTRTARWLAVAATVVLSLAPAPAASAAALPPVDGFAIDASLAGLPTKCLNATTGEWSVAWNFSVTSAINGFSVTAKNASAGGLILTSQAQKAMFPGPTAPRTISFTGSQTYFGKDAVTQTVSYDLLVSSAAAKDGKLVATTPVALNVPSPCVNSSSIATTTTTISSTSCSCAPVVTVKDPGATTTTAASTTSTAPGVKATGVTTTAALAVVLPGAASPGSTVAVLAVSTKPKALPRTGSDVRSLLATAGAFVIVGITLAALPRRRTARH